MADADIDLVMEIAGTGESAEGLGNVETSMRHLRREFSHGEEAAKGISSSLRMLSGEASFSEAALLQLSYLPIAMTSPMGMLGVAVGLLVNELKELYDAQHKLGEEAVDRNVVAATIAMDESNKTAKAKASTYGEVRTATLALTAAQFSQTEAETAAKAEIKNLVDEYKNKVITLEAAQRGIAAITARYEEAAPKIERNIILLEREKTAAEAKQKVEQEIHLLAAEQGAEVDTRSAKMKDLDDQIAIDLVLQRQVVDEMKARLAAGKEVTEDERQQLFAINQHIAGLKQEKEALTDLQETMKAVASDGVREITAFSEALGKNIAQHKNLKEAASEAGKAMLDSFLKDLAQEAQAEALKHLALGIGDAASPDPQLNARAAGEFEAAAAWEAVAAVTGFASGYAGGSGGGGGGGGGSGSGTAPTGGGVTIQVLNIGTLDAAAAADLARQLQTAVANQGL